MRVSNTLALLALTTAIDASPLFSLFQKRQTLSQFNDVDILNYALTLEHLEDKFYREGLANFTLADFLAAGFDEPFYQNLKDVSADESAHVAYLTAGLTAAGGKPVAECVYAFGITSVQAFVGTASILEGVGVSAYLGAAAQIANKAYLTAAGSILTIEARHSAYLRASLSQLPFPQSQDAPLSPNEVYTLAHGFIVSCPPANAPIPLKAFPAIAVTTTGAIRTGQTIAVSTDRYALAAKDGGAHLYAAFVAANGPVWAPLTSQGDGVHFSVMVPDGVFGQSYLVFSNCNTTVSDGSVVAGPALVEITRVVDESN